MKTKITGSIIKKIGRFSWVVPLAGLFMGVGWAFASTTAITLPFSDHFSYPGIIGDASSPATSGSLTWWLKSGAHLVIANNVAQTLSGVTPKGSYMQKQYAAAYPVASDQGAHPQNLFQMFLKYPITNPSAQMYFKRVADNLSNSANRQPYVGESLVARYTSDNSFYYGGIRADGQVVIKKKTNGTYQTLAMKKVLPGTYSSTNYDLIPLNQWIGLKLDVQDSSSGPQLSLYTDIGRTGVWTLALSAVDDPNKFGAAVPGPGLVGVKSDFADAQFDDFLLSGTGSNIVTNTLSTTSTTNTTSVTSTQTTTTSGSYDSVVLADKPVMYLKMNSANTGKETDATGNGHSGTYQGGTPSSGALPNGDTAAVFNGSSQYLTVPSSAALSIPTTHTLTWEGWVRPDTLNAPNASSDGYVDWMGKCEDYSPTCEWEARIYNATNPQNRPDRFSAYAFNPSAGLGSGADWQPASGWLSAGDWVYVVAEYQTTATPSGCNSNYPGTINIWVNGVLWDSAAHAPTGCMSQFSVSPKAASSPLDIGTMGLDTWFKGAVGKVAVYDHLLTQTQISAHFKAMTSKDPSGSCGATCTATMP